MAYCRRNDMLWSVLALWALWMADVALGQSDLAGNIEDSYTDFFLNAPNLVCIHDTVQNVDKVTVIAYYADHSVGNYSSLDAAAAAVPEHSSFVPGSTIVNIYFPGYNENQNSATVRRYVSDVTSVPGNRVLLLVDHSAYTGLLNDNNLFGDIPVINATTAAIINLASYRNAVSYVKSIAYAVCSKLLVALVSAGVSLDQMAIGGHSLGGWMTSYAALCMHNRYGKKVPNCTALDLAGPCYIGKRFAAEGCICSQCIMTNMGQFGSRSPSCSTNVVVNGGTHQPCSSSATGGGVDPVARSSHDFSVYFHTYCLRINNASVVQAVSASGAAAGTAGWCFDLPSGTYYADTTGIPITDC